MKSFKAFRLDTANHLLWRNGDRVPLAPKCFDVLAYLVERAGRVVTQGEILEALWSETYVNPELLRKYILEIRKALGDRPQNPEFIETLPKRGYRFVAPVIDESATDPPDLSRAFFLRIAACVTFSVIAGIWGSRLWLLGAAWGGSYARYRHERSTLVV
jgi:DNA-binding winged helix-turn-helix (wHTH) protein